MEHYFLGQNQGGGYIVRNFPHLRKADECFVRDDSWNRDILNKSLITCYPNVTMRRFTALNGLPLQYFDWKNLAIANLVTPNIFSYIPMEVGTNPSRGWAIGLSISNNYRMHWMSLSDFDSVEIDVEQMLPQENIFM
eukprot:c22056_g1_i2.p1 GENE.c22056_g1_i2~~c22056_g1_i2.p1  ORF type:complete len:137 (+),score=43.87 c22056_g1_i2:1143-1553(+)